ncbi:Kazal-type serine protease inhibitor family protein [Robiginitomaculum antarcticum]|uniref:hypothetical protein n=1 Tax=Robiginitomaculum antarcticum TaxID=437507 RepID=UPI0003A2C0F9|nr:hypothetical protein [Robiginitomaculum antarcticum]
MRALFLMTAMAILAACASPPPSSNPQPEPPRRNQQATGQMCGGIAGFTCADPNERCVIEAQKGCGYADQSGICMPQREMVCTMQYLPVCGCDGQTYGNSCMAGNAGVNIAYDGECQ